MYNNKRQCLPLSIIASQTKQIVNRCKTIVPIMGSVLNGSIIFNSIQLSVHVINGRCGYALMRGPPFSPHSDTDLCLDCMLVQIRTNKQMFNFPLLLGHNNRGYLNYIVFVCCHQKICVAPSEKSFRNFDFFQKDFCRNFLLLSSCCAELR